jgi:hypothetical protein
MPNDYLAFGPGSDFKPLKEVARLIGVIALSCRPHDNLYQRSKPSSYGSASALQWGCGGYAGWYSHYSSSPSDQRSVRVW